MHFASSLITIFGAASEEIRRAFDICNNFAQATKK